MYNELKISINTYNTLQCWDGLSLFFVTYMPPTAANTKQKSYLASILSHVGVLSICMSREMLYSY